MKKPPAMTKIPSKKVIKDEYDAKKGTREVDPRPEFSINADEFPAIKGWVTGQKYKVLVEIEQVGSRIGEWGDDKGKLVGSYKICGIANEEEEEKEEDENEGLPASMKKS